MNYFFTLPFSLILTLFAAALFYVPDELLKSPFQKSTHKPIGDIYFPIDTSKICRYNLF